MQADDPLFLPLAPRLALSYSRPADRPLMQALFAFDARLGGVVVQASEPMLAQLRLAWWREELSHPLSERAAGEPLLAELGEYWREYPSVLLSLIDGWETMLANPAFSAPNVDALVEARADGFAAIAEQLGLAQARKAATIAGRAWALGDLQGLSAAMQSAANEAWEREAPADIPKLPLRLRPLAILGRLGAKAISVQKEPLVSNRWDFLRIMRLGMIGR